MLLSVYSFLLFLLLSSSSVLGAHSSAENSHARRSLSVGSALVNRQGTFGNFGGGLDDIVGNVGDILGGNGGDGKTDGTDKPDGDNDDHSHSEDGTLSPSDSKSPVPLNTPTTTSISSSASSDVITTPTPHNTGILGGLGGVIDTLTSDAGGVLTGGSDTSTTSALVPTTSLLGPTSVIPSDASASTSAIESTITSAPEHGGGGILGPLTSILGPVTSAVLDPVTSAILNPVTSAILDPVTSAILDPVTSAILDPVTSAILNPVTSAILDPVTSAILNPVTSAILDPVTSAILDPVTSAIGPVTSAVLDPVTSAIGPVTSAILDPVTSAIGPVTSAIGPITSPISGVISSVTGEIPISTPTITYVPTPDSSTGASSPTSQPQPPISDGPTTSALPSISFPTPTGNDTTTIDPSDTQESSTTVTSTAVTTISIEPGLSFVLTESSLAYASMPTQVVQTLTDPDLPPEIATPVPAEAATTLITPPPLPTGIPARIFPRDQLDINSKDLSGYTLISILFNNELNWPFVVFSTLASSQIFAYVPVLITTALAIPSDQVKTYALQVYIPTTYRSPADATELGTTWLGYIPTDFVDTLTAQIKAKTSTFYTGVPDGVPKDLAQRVVSGYSLRSVADPNADPGSTGPTINGSSASGGGDDGKSRQDAIIGVVSALGAIALLVLVFLVYRSMKRRKQTIHHRLSDPPDEGLGVRPAGRQFDQDSVGGARRRSFYYAEDSLRGYEGQANEQLMQSASPTTMSQRRNVVPTSISAPILKGSTMNW